MTSMLQKFSMGSALLSAFFLGACSDGAASAAGDYVKASSRAEQISAAFEKADYAGALNIAQEVQSQVQGIIKKYPDSDVAFKIVSDENLRFGPWRYADFNKSVFPKIVAYADADFKRFDLTWTLAYSLSESDDLAVLNFATFAAYYQERVKALRAEGLELKNPMSPEESENMALRAATYLKRADAKAAFANTMAAVEELASKPVKKPARVPYKPADTTPRINIPIDNAAKFLADANKEAARVVYNLDASQKLLAMADSALADSAVRPQFAEILNTALENAQKITSLKLKNPSTATIVHALSKIGYNDDALLGTLYIEKDPSLKAACLERITYSYSANKDFKGALNVLSAYPEGTKKTEMLVRLSADLTREGISETAIEVASKIKDISARSSAYILIAGSIWNTDSKKALELLSQTSPAFVSERVLMDFCMMSGVEFKTFVSKDARTVSAFCAIAQEILPLNREVFARWEAAALNAFSTLKGFSSGNDKRDVAALALIVCRMEFEAGKHEEVLSQSLMLGDTADPQGMVVTLCELGLEAALRGDAVLSENLFVNALSLAKSKSLESNLPSNLVFIAWQIQLSGFDRAKSLEMLSAFMPKLN